VKRINAPKPGRGYSCAMPSSEAIRPTILAWVLALGGTGFVLGYFAPIVLAPEANTGPLLGLFIAGPAGAIAGLVLGVAFRLAPVGNRVREPAFRVAVAIVGAATLYFSLPEPALHGYVLDAAIESCSRPATGLAAAVTTWEQAVARVTWATPAANWREAAASNIERDPGVVVGLRVQRKAAIFRHRAPWDRNRLTAGPWTAVDELKPYYANDAGGACEPYLARARALYWPAVDADAASPRPAEPWPPTDTRGFLQLQTLGGVPPEYARLLF
jgi:hypothetical protein